MKQLKLFFYLMAWLLGMNATGAYAQAEVSPYKFEFSASWTTLGTASTVTYPSVGTGWGRFWEEGSATSTRVSYGRNTGTANNHTTTGAIASSVLVSQTNNASHDMLVTPLVKGNISLWAKKYGTSAAYTGFIKLYAMEQHEDADGVYYTMKSATPIKEVTLTTTTYQQITATLDEYTYVGIQPQYCYFDDFSADYAKVDLQTKARISALANQTSPTTYDDADENGTVSLKFTVTLLNEGDLDIAGDLNLRVYSANGYDQSKTLTGANIKVGGNQTFGTSAAPNVFSFEIADYPDPADYYAVISGDGFQTAPFRLFSRTISPTPYGAKAKPRLSTNQNLYYKSEDNIKFQPATAARTLTVQLQNTGTLPLTISEVNVPEGFTSNLSTSTTVAKHGSSNFTITSSDITPGHHEGVFSFKTNGGNFTWNLSYDIADGYCENFETTSNPGYLAREGTNEWASSSWVSNMLIDDNRNAFQHASSKPSKLLLPLLEVKAGDVFSFDAARLNKAVQIVDGDTIIPTPTAASISLWYSPDRANWTLAKTVTDLPTDYVIVQNSCQYPFATFTVDNLPAGNYYLAFTGDSIILDNMYGKVGYKQVEQAHNLVITAKTIPTDGAVNAVYKASAMLYNAAATVEPATYTAKLYFGDQEMGQAQPVELAASASYPMTAQRIAFSLTPHQAGTFPARIELVTADGYVAKTEDVSVTIAPESGTLDQAAGEANSSVSPLNNTLVAFEMVYPAEKITLPAGTAIKSIAFKGFVGVGSMGNMTPTGYDLKMYVESTEDGAYATPYVLANTAAMTNVLDQHVEFAFGTGNGGYDSQAGATIATEPEDLIRANLATPIVYDGKNLRIVLSGERTSVGVVPYFESDRNVTDHAILKSAYNADQFETVAINQQQLPVVYLGVDIDPVHVTGTVTNAEGQTVEGVSIDLQSNDDDVDYKATTDAAGQYTIEMFRVNRNFHQRIEKQGYYPQDYDFDVDADVQKNIQLVTATGLYPESLTQVLPDGEVNSPYTATIEVSNFTTGDIAAADYTATLYVNGEAVATATPAAVGSEEETTLTFTYTPHEAGTFPAYIELSHANGTVNVSTTEDIVIGQEVIATVHQVGTPQTETSNTSGVFAYTGQRKALVEFYYTEAELQAADIQVGDIIKGVTVKGWANQSTPVQFATKVYMQQTDKTTPTWTSYNNFSLNDVSAMTQVYDGTITIEAKGSSSALVPFHELTFDDAFVYQGGNLAFTVVTEGASTANAWYLYDKNGNSNSVYAYYYNNSATTYDRAYRTNRAVLFLDVDRFRTLSGQVTLKDTETPLEGVSVTVKHDDVEYYGTTDADGRYEVVVGKFQDDYNVTFFSTDYSTVTKPVSFEEGDQVVNAELDAIRTISGTVTNSTTGQPIEGVAVTLKNGREVYTDTTDEQGHYSIDVVRFNQDYTATYKAEGYETHEETVSFANGTFTKDVQLVAYRLLSGKVVDQVSREGISRAAIKLTNGTTTYETLAETDGTYTITVYDLDGEYTATVSAFSHDTLTVDGIVFGNDDVVRNYTLVPYRILTGTVLREGTHIHIANATVTISNGTTELTAVTPTDGTFSFKIYDFATDFTATATADGYEPQTLTVSLADGDQSLEFYLGATPTGIDAIGVATSQAKTVYTLGGQLVGKEIDTKTLKPGAYIIDGRKVVVK